MGFPGGSGGKEFACSEEDLGSIPGLGRVPGGGHGKPLQHSFLENSHGRGSLAGYSAWSHKGSDTTEWVSLHFCWEMGYFSSFAATVSTEKMNILVLKPFHTCAVTSDGSIPRRGIDGSKSNCTCHVIDIVCIGPYLSVFSPACSWMTLSVYYQTIWLDFLVTYEKIIFSYA